MSLQAYVRPASDGTLEEVRQAVVALVGALSEHLDALAALPPGQTRFTVLADLHEPVRRAVARWDRAVLAHTGTLPVAVDDGWPEDLDE